MSLEQIIAVETRGAGFVPLHGGMIEKRIVQQVAAQNLQIFFPPKPRTTRHIFPFLLERAYQLPVKVRHMV